MHPLKWLKKIIPKRHEITNHKHLSWLGATLHDPNLWHFNRKSVSRGLAVGLFAAFIPLPIQMVVAVLLAILFRGNLLTAAAGTWITNPITFIPLNYFIFMVGKFITGDTSDFVGIPDYNFDHDDFSKICEHTWQWLESIGKPFLVGLPFVALSVSLSGYVIINVLWNAMLYLKPKRLKTKG